MTFDEYTAIPPSLWDIVAASKQVKKVWGWEFWVTFEELYTFKILLISPGFQCSLHYHPVKTENFSILTGRVWLEQRDVRGTPIGELLVPGMQRHIEPKTPHRFGSVDGAVIFEMSSKHSDLDVVRITESGKI